MTCLTMDLLGFVPFGICSASCICLSICVSCQFGGVCSDHFFEYSSFSFLLSSWDSEMIKMLVLLLVSQTPEALFICVQVSVAQIG